MSNDYTADPRYRPYRTDLTPNHFSLMQRDAGFEYEDALEPGDACGPGEPGEPGEVRSLFFPGCSLVSYSRELTLAAFDFLKERGLVDGMSARCCGHILRFSADQSDCRAYTGDLAALLASRSVARIVTACPNCYASLLGTLGDSGIELVGLSELLVEEGVRISPERIAPATSICIHDSCPDSRLGVFGPSVRRLFEHVELREMRHKHEDSLCCGLGCLLFVSDPARSEKLRKQRIAEFGETGADLLVTYCFSCDSAFQDSSEGVTSLHYLELLFDTRVDWDAVTASARQAQRFFEESREDVQEESQEDLSS